eukprot:CAMPEP_0194117050 /NCGR_PEP_ID=MMETSP0150-20130528/29508_1 /TAXON_ID=122233 /ORGANISM="Chaetoceros debilis, Strain MM31A-1" /LENGTH=160 /DNA_ID=CAMNT_0038807927 /DNA_START=145 /DNA_END=623 /DNA_ORIENTATION=-
MLSSLWNQITQVDSDDSDDDPSSFPSKPLHEDDIVASSLLSTFPSYGSHRKKASASASALQLESQQHSQSPSSSSVTSIVSGEWELGISPRKGTKKNKKSYDDGSGSGGGFFGFDDILNMTPSRDDDDRSISSEGRGHPNRGRKHMAHGSAGAGAGAGAG